MLTAHCSAITVPLIEAADVHMESGGADRPAHFFQLSEVKSMKILVGYIPTPEGITALDYAIAEASTMTRT